MGSLAVLLKIGLFQINGGTEANPEYQIGSPVFDEVLIELNQDYFPGQTSVISAADNGPENIYVEKLTLNGQPVETYSVTHNDIVNGGSLLLETTAQSKNGSISKMLQP